MMLRCRRPAWTAMLCGGLVTATLAQVPVTQPPVFRTATDLVTLDVSVTIDGTPVGALTANHFVVTDNGVAQTVEMVDAADIPAEITIIIDLSDLMSDTLESMVPDIDRIVSMVRPGDKVRLMAIDSHVRDVIALQARADWPRVEPLATNDLAPAHDALAAALMRHQDPDRQHIIVALTNGEDTGSVLSAEAVVEIAKRSRATLHIVALDMVCDDTGCSTRKQRLNSHRATTANLILPTERFWRPVVKEWKWETLKEAAELTGGAWHMPDPIVNRNASIIFRKFYETSRRRYRLRYVPQGVSREGWHDVAVTVPQFPAYRITARSGYAVERSSSPPPTPPRTAGLPAIIDAWDRGDLDAVRRQVQASTDPAQLVADYLDGVNPWPATPQREAAFVLDLAQAVLARGSRDAVAAVRDLLNDYRRLVRSPMGPGAFERFWLWTAATMTLGANQPDLTREVLDDAMARYPDEPRLVLMHAFLIDRRRPFGADLPASHVRDVLAAYDAVIAHPETTDEGRIRQAWLLHRINRHSAALMLLESTSLSGDVTLVYLRQLMRGRVLDALQRTAEARDAYRAAHALAPTAQSPRVALMRHALISGDHAEAAALAEAVQIEHEAHDPWWVYWQGDYRLFSASMTRMRAQVR